MKDPRPQPRPVRVQGGIAVGMQSRRPELIRMVNPADVSREEVGELIELVAQLVEQNQKLATENGASRAARIKAVDRAAEIAEGLIATNLALTRLRGELIKPAADDDDGEAA